MKTAQRTFYILICGTLLIFIAGFFIVSEIQSLAQQLQPTPNLIATVNATTKPLIMITNKSSNQETMQLLNLEHLLTTNLQQNKAFLLHTRAIQPNTNRIIWAIAGFVLIGIILLIALIALCFWAIKRLTIPLTELSQAAKRFGIDITEMNEVIEAFNQMQARIQKSIHDRTHMLAAISHDLRTPITRLKLRAEYFSDSPQYKEMLTDFNEMENMISSVLLFAREDAYNEPMDRFDLDALLDSLCEDILNAGLKVKYRGLGQRLPFFGRINTLKRAFANLIQNAVKYGKEATVKLNYNKDAIRVEINDKGPGIPEDALEKVFEPFYRVEPSRSPQTGGTGLGLAITKDAILAHSGDIVLRNLTKGGLQAIITLPLKQD